MHVFVMIGLEGLSP